MSEVINLTLTEEVEVFQLTLKEENPISIGFYNVAIPDSRVGDALQKALEAQAAAEAAAALAAQAGQQAVDDAFATKTTSDLTEGANLYFTDVRAKAAAVVNATSGSEIDQAPSVSAVKSYVNTALQATVLNLGDPSIDGTWRIIVNGANLLIEKRISSVWTTISEFNS